MAQTGQDNTCSAADLASMLSRCDVIDLAPLLFTNMPRWSTHPDLAIIHDARNFAQNGYFLQTLVLPEHVGCHVDAPAHFHEALAGKTIDTFAPDCVMGPAKKVDVSGLDLKPGDLLTVSQFERAAERSGIDLQEGDIALIEFGWDKVPARWKRRLSERLVGKQQPRVLGGTLRPALGASCQGRWHRYRVSGSCAEGRCDHRGPRSPDLLPSTRHPHHRGASKPRFCARKLLFRRLAPEDPRRIRIAA